ncbi:MAG TPA: glycosyltransferase [Chloroflexota bacterium]|nr:glycosyltransferase [Chloroflexota bacterium]
MTRTLSAVLVTLGDPHTLTGGYLFHRRLSELAPRHDARLDFISVPERRFPLAVGDGCAVLRRVAQSGADIAVLDSIAAAYLGPWLWASEPPLPMVGMLHQPPGGIDYGPPRQPVQAWLDRLAYRRLRRLLVASEALAGDLRHLGQPADRIHVIPPGRDVAQRVGPSPGDLRQGRRTAFLCVGNWVERKGILSLLEALAQVAPEAATLHLVGATDVEPTYAARVRRRLGEPDLTDRVVVHGPLNVEDVAAMYQAADAFVLPSLKEPFGTVYGEAMAFGLSVVGWRAGNLPFLAEDNREGLLVTPGDVRGLGVALQRLADEPDLRQRLGQAAKIRASARPTWDEVAALFFEHLRQVSAST